MVEKKSMPADSSCRLNQSFLQVSLRFMKVVITSATSREWAPAAATISPRYGGENSPVQETFHQSGVGMLATAVSLTRLLLTDRPDLIIQAGIAGTFDTCMKLGDVVAVKEEMLGDMGVEENQVWKDIFDMKLEKSDHPPFEKGKLVNPFLEKYNLLHLPEVSAVTVNEISTHPLRMKQLLQKYNPVLESMEGAALHYVGSLLRIPFIQLRSISNYTGDRDKNHWRIVEAIRQLNQVLCDYVATLPV